MPHARKNYQLEDVYPYFSSLFNSQILDITVIGLEFGTTLIVTCCFPSLLGGSPPARFNGTPIAQAQYLPERSSGQSIRS
mmetsp:Transcript_6598/g.18703  ORF Transcript_6598/g.18703 Transcript_6598/m.18703 type:complete len:80 (+) Transcript_6598:111-350(+)